MSRPKNPPNPNARSQERYHWNRIRQVSNGHEWKLTWQDWHDFWLTLGVDKNTSAQKNTKDMLCLTRKDPLKPFQKSNLKAVDKSEMLMGKPKPRAWFHKDPAVHAKFDPWHKARSQANFRQEGWTLTFEEFQEFWTDELWSQRGRASQDLAMTRVDPEQPWSKENVIIVTRRVQLQMAHAYRLEQGLYGPRAKRNV